MGLASNKPDHPEVERRDLPTYGNPPLVETVMSVQFEPIAKMSDAHLGAYWFQRKDTWPVVLTQEPIESIVESFDESDRWFPPGVGFRFGGKPHIRVQLIDESRGRMIQLQRDRFAFNWRRPTEGEYPRFAALRTEFDNAWSDILSFTLEEELGVVNPQMWEVVYVNHIKKDDLWQEPLDWPKVLSGLLADSLSPADGVKLHGCLGQWVFDLTPRRGRLFVDVAPGRTTDKNPVDLLVLRLTARGPINESQPLDDGLNLGHRVIVQSFDRLISPKARQHWQRHDNAHKH